MSRENTVGNDLHVHEELWEQLKESRKTVKSAWTKEDKDANEEFLQSEYYIFPVQL